MKYTTLTRLQKKLQFRLGIDTTPNLYPSEPFPGITASVTQQNVDPELLEMIIEEKEAFLDALLRQMYKMPLKNSHVILSEIVEGLVIADVMRVYFQGIGMASIAADVSTMSVELKGQSYYLLGALTAGRNLYLPNSIPVPGNIPGMPAPTPLVLEGEELVTPTQLLKNVDTVIATRERSRSFEDMGIDWDIDQDSLIEDAPRSPGALVPR